MPWLDLEEGIAELFGEFADDLDALVDVTLGERAARRRERQADAAAERRVLRRLAGKPDPTSAARRSRFVERHPNYWHDRRARERAARPRRRCESCAAELPVEAHASRRRCEGGCVFAGPFVVMLDRAGAVDRSPPILDLPTAARVARGAACFHRAIAAIEMGEGESRRTLARFVEVP